MTLASDRAKIGGPRLGDGVRAMRWFRRLAFATLVAMLLMQWRGASDFWLGVAFGQLLIWIVCTWMAVAVTARRVMAGPYALRQTALAVALTPLLGLGVWLMPSLVFSDAVKWGVIDRPAGW